MLRPSALTALALGLGLAVATPTKSLSRRWDTTICPANPGAPIPDENNFKLPLEGDRQDMCFGFCVGDVVSCPVKALICYNFVGYTLVFHFPAIPGYTYVSTDVALDITGPPSGNTSHYTTGSGHCAATVAGGVDCTIPYSKIAGGSNPSEWLKNMCPNGDQFGMLFYLTTTANLLDSSNNPVSGEARQSCNDYPTCSSHSDLTYWELSYRCTNCPSTTSSTSSTSSTPTPTPTPIECGLGTAFGYSPSLFHTFNSQNPLPNTCKRWGWYFTPTQAQFTAGIGGPLYVGAGQNDINKAVYVGTWSAVLVSGKVTVTYTLQSGYDLSEVHVDLRCTPIATCAPGQYLYGNTDDAALGTLFTTPPLTYPSCGGGSQVYLIVHAKVDVTVTTTSCPAPLAT